MTIYIIAIIAAVIILITIAVIIIRSKRTSDSNSLTEADFQSAKNKMKPYCSKEDFDDFFNFIRKYEGGYYRRRNGKVVYRDYLGKEKGDLKGIFFNIIIPNPNISVEDKESYRAFMLSKGVKGVDKRPLYETRDSKLKNKEVDEDDYIRKQVGNIGENDVRTILDQLDKNNYYVINGPVLKYQDTTKEFDHIVIGTNGVFIIETKAFGMTDGLSSYSVLFIDEGDKWIIRKNNKNRDLTSPTDQITAEKLQIENIFYNSIEVKPILVLSNKEIRVKQNIELPYEVLRIDKLINYIEASTSNISESKRNNLLEIIDEARINQ